MHDPADRNTNSMMLASPNRLLNIHPPKLSRPSQQQNLSKKMKVSHMNGVRPTSNEGNSTVRSSKSDTSLRCPLRQTLPIFKQPVTYYPTQRDEVKPQVNQTTANNTSGGKPSEKTKPRQLFWEKRFQNIRPTDIDGQPFEHFKLPEQIKGISKVSFYHKQSNKVESRILEDLRGHFLRSIRGSIDSFLVGFCWKNFP